MNKRDRITMPARPATTSSHEFQRETLAMIERGDFARLSEAERLKIVVTFVGMLSDAEVQAIGSNVNALAERRAA